MDDRTYIIYALKNSEGVFYIGLTCRPEAREQEHKRERDEQAFVFVVLEDNLDLAQAQEREVFYIALGKANGWSLINLQSGGCSGTKHSPETCRKISEAAKGRTGYEHTPEAKLKISETSKQMERTKEMYEKVSKALTGKPHPHKGVPRSEECKKKIGDAHRGMKHTEEAKRKIGEAGRGRKRSPETRRKMSEAAKKRKYTSEGLQKIKEAAILREKKKRTKRALQLALQADTLAYRATILTLGGNQMPLQGGG